MAMSASVLGLLVRIIGMISVKHMSTKHQKWKLPFMINQEKEVCPLAFCGSRFQISQTVCVAKKLCRITVPDGFQLKSLSNNNILDCPVLEVNTMVRTRCR